MRVDRWGWRRRALAGVLGYVLVTVALAQPAAKPPLATDAVLGDGHAVIGKQVDYLEDPQRQFTIGCALQAVPRGSAQFRLLLLCLLVSLHPGADGARDQIASGSRFAEPGLGAVVHAGRRCLCGAGCR